MLVGDAAACVAGARVQARVGGGEGMHRAGCGCVPSAAPAASGSARTPPRLSKTTRLCRLSWLHSDQERLQCWQQALHGRVHRRLLAVRELHNDRRRVRGGRSCGDPDRAPSYMMANGRTRRSSGLMTQRARVHGAACIWTPSNALSPNAPSARVA